jgi:hypothetical protein
MGGQVSDNRTTLLLLAGLAAAAGLFVYSRTKEGELAAVDLAEDAAGTLDNIVVTVKEAAVAVARWVSRGLRNNNPGNIRKSGDSWQGLASAQPDTAFFSFISMEYGIRALAVILKNYQRKYGLNTVRKMVTRWAPPAENDTTAYVNAVAKAVGVGADTPIDIAGGGPNDGDLLLKLVRAIMRHENGVEASLVSDDTVSRGVSLA